MKKQKTKPSGLKYFQGLILFIAFISFSIDINAQPACAGMPPVGNIVTFQNPVCPGSPFVILLTNPPNQTGIVLQWLSSSNGSNFVPIAGANQQQLQTSILQQTYFRCRITCTLSGQFSISNIILITVTQPVIQYPPLTVQLNEGESTLPDNTGFVTFSTPCCTGTVTYSDQVSSSCCQSVITRTWTIIDCFGEGTTFVQTITVLLDVDPPVITCTPLAPGACNTSPTPDATTVTVVDQCPATLTSTTSDAAGTRPCELITTITWTATDQCGHSSTCTQTYSRIMDSEPPVIVCPSPASLPCNTTPTPDVHAISATDNCGTPEITLLNSSTSTTGCLVTYTFTWRAMDGCGNFSDCNQVLTSVHDLTPPVITCPAPDTFPCNLIPFIDPSLISATDNCGTPVITLFGTSNSSSGCFVTTIDTWKATDACGNFSLCDQRFVAMFDLIPPVIHCPDPVSIDCNTVPTPSPSSITATDNCGTPTINLVGSSSSTFECTKTYIFKWRATDACGNFSECDQVISSVTDQIDPFIECPDPITLPCNTTPVPNEDLIAASDNCSTPVVTLQSTDISDIGCLRIFELTWRATDECGNFSECTQIYFSDFDLIPPIINCPAPDTLCNVTPTPSIGLISATDNCSTAEITFVGTTTSTVGCVTKYNFTWKATDDCGNFSTCVQEIYVINDTEAPVIHDCPNSQSVPTEAGLCGAHVTWIPPTVTDNCGIKSFTNTFAPGGFFPVGNTTVTYTAMDLCGHVTTCEFVINVVDVEPPWNMHCPGVIIQNNDPGKCSAVVTWDVSATDNCAVESIVSVPESGSEFQVGVTPVLVTATDVNGNTWTCTFDVHVNDTEKPVFTNCQGNTFLLNDNGKCFAQYFPSVPDATDNCGVDAVVEIAPHLINYPVGTTTVIFKATDIHGNFQLCTFDVTVFDVDPPVITNCPANIRVDNDPTVCRAKVTWIVPTATDNCGMLSFTSDHNPGDDFPVGVTIVTYTATDIHGNVSTCTFKVTVDDNEDPFILSHDIVTCDSVVNYNFVIDDNCRIEEFTYIPPSGSVFPIGTTLVYVEAWDIHNNFSFKYFNVTVLAPASKIDSVKSSNSEICLGDSIILTAYFDTLGAGGTIKLFKNVCGSSAVIDSGREVDNSWSVTIIPSDTGRIIYYVRIEGICDTTDCATDTLFVNPCGITVNLKIFIEGYYSGGGMMDNGGNGGDLLVSHVAGATMNESDTVFVSLMAADPPYSEIAVKPGILMTDGNISVPFGQQEIANIGASAYIKIMQRNTVETWSANPVSINLITNYDFTTAQSQAFSDNLKETPDHFGWAIYSGDINKDGSIDASDFLELDPFIQNGDGGYLPGDLNGDGSVDASDFLVLDPNIQDGIGAATP